MSPNVACIVKMDSVHAGMFNFIVTNLINQLSIDINYSLYSQS